MRKKKKCEYCGEEFEAKGKKRFCNRNCKNYACKRRRVEAHKNGPILKGALSVINPTLGSVLEGAVSVEDAIAGILGGAGKAKATPEENWLLRAKELVLEAYEAEVSDRIAARQREMAVAASGGSDILFKTIGWSISVAFLIVVAAAVGLWEVQPEQQRLFDMGFGAVIAQMTAVVSYYFGSSFGSKQKTQLLGNETSK